MIFYMDQIASQIIHAKSDMFIIRNTNYYYDYLKLSIYQYENIQKKSEPDLNEKVKAIFLKKI